MTVRIEPKRKEHKNPTDPQRIASAPYNFIPLPEVVVTAVENAEQLPHHNTYANEGYTHTGYFDVTLTTKSPLYVRAPLTLQEFEKQERGDEPKDDFRAQAKNKADFFYTRKNDSPVIPGSSLRGMLRGLLEIVSYGKMTRVTDKKLFYRTVDDTAVGVHYRDQMVEDLGNIKGIPYYATRVKGGFFRILGDGTYEIEECAVARVDMKDIAKAFGKTTEYDLYELNGNALDPTKPVNPNVTPRWDVQHADIWLDIGPEKEEFFKKRTIPIRRRDGTMGERLIHPDLYLRMSKGKNLSTTSDPNKAKGTIVLTGWMQNKHWGFVFGPKTGKTVDVWEESQSDDWSRRLVERFQDDDQISQWQEKAFPPDKPNGTERAQKGYLRDGEPVFYLEEDGHAKFFGRAQLFRLPYNNSPRDLLPEQLRDPMLIDFAEAMFGFVHENKQAKQGEKARAYASRVFVTDAALGKAYDEKQLWLTGNIKQQITPPILATPKPTAFQQYLVQLIDPDKKWDEQKKILTHYDSPTKTDDGKESPKTTIRGHKLYWHQGKKEKDKWTAQALTVSPLPPHNSTQHTQFRPVRDGVEFKFRVFFENLSEEELGALCWTLQPLGEANKDYCHALGMGKPFGMGAVKLSATLHLTDRKARYGALFTDKDWAEGETTVETLDRHALETRVAPFEQYVLQALQPNEPVQHLYEMPRVAMLLKMMEFPGFAAEKVLDGKPAHQQNRMLANHPNTRYMMIKIPGVQRDGNEYKERPVLPDVTAFMTGQEKKTAQPVVYREGTELTATVENEKEGFVYLEIPAQNPDKRFGVIDPEDRKGLRVNVGDALRVKIVGFDEEDGAQVLLCAPV